MIYHRIEARLIWHKSAPRHIQDTIALDAKHNSMEKRDSAVEKSA